MDFNSLFQTLQTKVTEVSNGILDQNKEKEKSKTPTEEVKTPISEVRPSTPTNTPNNVNEQEVKTPDLNQVSNPSTPSNIQVQNSQNQVLLVLKQKLQTFEIY